MSMPNKICQQCGSRFHSHTSRCHQAEVEKGRERELAALETLLEPGVGVIQLEFEGSPDQQRQLVNRLRAEWRLALEVIEPSPECPWFLANVARLPQDLGGPLNAVYTVSMAGVVRNQAHVDWQKFWVSTLAV